MGGFFSALFGGSSPGLNQSLNEAGTLTSFGSGLGTSDLNADSNFWRTILSGDQQAISQLLAPEISTIQGQGQQQIQNQSQFGNRSGGTNAVNQTNIDSQRQQVEQMIAGLTGQAASQVGQLGEFGIQTALNANQQRGGFAQQKLQNEQGSIFGQALSGLSGFGLDALTGGLTSGFGGGGGGGFPEFQTPSQIDQVEGYSPPIAGIGPGGYGGGGSPATGFDF